MEDEPFLTISWPSPWQIRAEAAYLYDAVHLYAKGLISVLRIGGSPRNGTAIIEEIKGQTYFSAMGYMVQIDENADASGNYTLLTLADNIILAENGTGPPIYGLVPVGTFGAPLDKNKLPVSGPSKADKEWHWTWTYHILFHFKYLELSGDIYWVGARPPIAEPPCGFRGEKCISECDKWPSWGETHNKPTHKSNSPHSTPSLQAIPVK